MKYLKLLQKKLLNRIYKHKSTINDDGKYEVSHQLLEFYQNKLSRQFFSKYTKEIHLIITITPSIQTTKRSNLSLLDRTIFQ